MLGSQQLLAGIVKGAVDTVPAAESAADHAGDLLRIILAVRRAPSESASSALSAFNPYCPSGKHRRYGMRIGVDMRVAVLGMCGALALVTAATAQVNHVSDPRNEVEINTGDVDLFFRIYDASHGRPTTEQVQRDYLDAGSDGLRTFARVRGTTAQRIVDAIVQQPALYADARRCVAAIPAARPRLAAALNNLRALYPNAVSPPVTIAIGRGRPVGVGSPVEGLQIGIEALCGVQYYAPDPADRLVFVIAHEYVHVQQRRELVDNDANWTVLEGSLVEGAADFVGELISGGLGNPQLARDAAGRETEIEERFLRDKDKTDLTGWLNDGTMERSGNLGYWVGYRIVRAYYNNAPDKRAAIREIIEMRDPAAFLARSGWYPGIRL